MSKIDELISILCPEGVTFYSLGELGKFYGGITGKSKKDFINGNAKFITYRNVYSNPALDLDTEERVRIEPGERQRTLEYCDVIFTGSSETPDECGLSSVVTQRSGEPLYLNSFCFAFRFNDPSIMLPDFSKHLFRSTDLRYQIGKTASGVTRYNVSKKLMEKVTIPVPPLEVQREIVRILDNFMGLTAEIIAKLTAELTARKQQYEYYRNEMLSFAPEVVWKTLGDIGKVSMCKRIMKNETSTEGDIPFYKIGTFGKEPDAYISRELFEKYKSQYSYPNKGDILISAAGTIGRTVVFDGEPAYFQDSNIVWIANDETQVLNEFLFYWYQTSPWKVSAGGTIARLYNDNIAGAKVPVLPKETQKRLVSVLKSFSAICSDLNSDLSVEIDFRQKQYDYYRDKLLTFKEA